MKHFGTVKSFDEEKGLGSIKAEEGGEELRFDRSAISWEPKTSPKEGQRLTYDLNSKDGRNTAVNLQTI
ncbi:MAG TPA: cold shock domain-containing protein [Sphingomicrobium sp.]